MVPDSKKEYEGWSATGKITVVLETTGLHATDGAQAKRAHLAMFDCGVKWRQGSLLEPKIRLVQVLELAFFAMRKVMGQLILCF